MPDIVCVKSCNTRLEAELDKSLLDSHGIESMISADDAGGMRPDLLWAAGGVRLLVKQEDAQKALKLL